ncbi:MAG: hypothetical protein HQL24_08695, partial [Candidatus Omnitrophica bacterium]|nr:hypothetical protein [Candidatus Omnitrophota bacterium]
MLSNKKDSVVSSFIRRIWHWRLEVVAIALSCWGFYLRSLCLFKRELWGDELYSLKCITGPIKPLLWVLNPNGEQICFPGYYYM